MKIWLGFVLTGLSLALGCASGTLSDGTTDPAAPVWPSDDPRVRFEKSVETFHDLGRSSFFQRLTGQSPQALFSRPFGVAWDGDDLIVTDPGTGLVLKLTEKGKVIRTGEGVLTGPVGVAVCLGGVVVTDSRSGRVALFDQRLQLIRWLAEDLERPTGVACIPGGVAVIETAAHRVVLLGSDGERRNWGTRGAEAGEFNFPTAIAAEGSLMWIGDTLNFRVVTMDSETGETIGSFGHLGDSPGETPRVKGIALDFDGHLWVSDAHLDVVALFDQDGTFLMDIGGQGRAEGEFSFPSGIATHPDGRVAIADSLNQRIQVFRILDSQSPINREGQ